MIYIFHGTDTAHSRNAFLDAKKTKQDCAVFDGGKLDLMSLRQVIEGGGLFGDEKTVVIEELFSKRKASKELDTLLQYLADHQGHDILLWESKELTPKQASLFPKAKILKYTLPSELFTFLDSIRPGGAKQSLLLLHQVLDTQDAEMVFFLLIRQIRLLLALKDPGTDAIDEVVRLAPWQRGKLQKQADQFEVGELIQLYEKLYNLEYAMKTGRLQNPLSQELDYIVILI